jgi:hypothetical protein
MSELIWLIIWLVCALLVAGALLGVVRAVLATPPFANVQPYANVIYALVVLLIVLVLVSMFMNGVPIGFNLERHRG